MSSTVIFVEVKSFTSGFVKRVSKTIKCGGESGNFEVEDKWEPLYPLAEFKIRVEESVYPRYFLLMF